MYFCLTNLKIFNEQICSTHFSEKQNKIGAAYIATLNNCFDDYNVLTSKD